MYLYIDMHGQLISYTRYMTFTNVISQLSGGFNHFLFSPLFGEDSHFDDHIFQMGWFNHQPDNLFPKKTIASTPWLVGLYRGLYYPII